MDVDESRAIDILVELSAAARFEEVPSLLVRPTWLDRPASDAAANADMNCIEISPRLLQTDELEIRCVLAHEMGHLHHQHGKGWFWGFWGFTLLSLAVAIVVWVVAEFDLGAMVFCLMMGWRYFMAAERQAAYRAHWASNQAEIEAEKFARSLVGDSVYEEFRRRREAHGHRRPQVE